MTCSLIKVLKHFFVAKPIQTLLKTKLPNNKFVNKSGAKEWAKWNFEQNPPQPDYFSYPFNTIILQQQLRQRPNCQIYDQEIANKPPKKSVFFQIQSISTITTTTTTIIVLISAVYSVYFPIRLKTRTEQKCDLTYFCLVRTIGSTTQRTQT